MNILYLIGRICLSFVLSCVTSIFCAITTLSLLASFVDVLKLNYKSDTYWVLNVALVGLVISWIISFISFMSIIR